MNLYIVRGFHKATKQNWEAQFLAVSKNAILRVYDLGGIDIKYIEERPIVMEALFIKQVFGKEKLPS